MEAPMHAESRNGPAAPGVSGDCVSAFAMVSQNFAMVSESQARLDFIPYHD
jgi:hypothetical protein